MVSQNPEQKAHDIIDTWIEKAGSYLEVWPLMSGLQAIIVRCK